MARWRRRDIGSLVKAVSPVYDGYFADPFAWQHGGEYFAIGTGQGEACGNPNGRVFPLLHSKDFHRWEPAGVALIRPDNALGDTFWAPEVAYANGMFHLYYSVGWADRSHHLKLLRARCRWDLMSIPESR